MINLIPVSAKKKLHTEYWIRTLSVWGILWAITLVLSAVALLPAFVVISQQVQVYQVSAALASEKVAEYEDVSGLLRVANVQAQDLTTMLLLQQPSEYIRIIKDIAVNNEVTLNQLRLQRGEGGVFGPIGVSGVAVDRQSLQDFRDALLAETWVTQVDLPISNLAQGSNIGFDITVTVTSIE
jgi:hypothetical protein